MRKLHFKTLVVGAMLCSTTAAMAVPAKPGVHQWTQADGTVINVQLVGDEHHHYYLTEDNYLIVNNDGIFYFAEVIDDNEVVATHYRAANVGARTAEVSSFLAGIDRDEVLQAQSMQWENAREGMMKAGPGLFAGTTFPSIGEQKAVVILVEYQDVKFTTPNPHEYFNNMLNQEGFSEYGGTGSCRDFYIASSHGMFIPTFDLYGPVTLAHDRAYYGGHSGSSTDARPQEMAIEACQLLDATVDFSQYDRDNDGVIDNVFIFYAGRGEATGGGDDSVWPHASSVGGSYTFDGKRLRKYGCTNEWTGSRPDGIGTFCHEFGHILGLPDLYATTYPTPAPFTTDAYDTMCSGSYNNDGCTPPMFSAFERYALGWVEPTKISGPMNGKLLPLNEENSCYIINTSDENEYFLFENRQQKGWDTYIPGHGMLVWHIDYNSSVWSRNIVCNNANHQYVDLEEADNILTDATRSGDTFPGAAGITSFTDDTTPSMRTWKNVKLNLPITDIKESAPDGVITFKVGGGAAPANATTTFAATDVTPRSFRAHWADASGATGYRLSVFTKNADGSIEYAPGYDHRDVGFVTVADVKGLNPSTNYLYTVMVETEISNSPESNEMAVATPALTQEYVIPVALPATDINVNSFTANWEALDNADSYLLSVSRRRVSGATVLTETFDGSKSSWFTSSSTFNTGSAYSGKKSPSLKTTDGNFVSTSRLDGTVTAFSFWHRGYHTTADCRLMVEAMIQDAWTPVAEVPIVTARGGVTTELYNFPEGTEAVRVIFYSNAETAVMYFDDLSVSYGGKVTVTPLADYTDKPMGNATSAEVSGTDGGTEYLYSVKSVKGGVNSMSSALQRVKTEGESGIDAVEADADAAALVATDGNDLVINATAGAQVVVADAAGRTIYAGMGGTSPLRLSVAPTNVYIVKVDDRAVKVAVK